MGKKLSVQLGLREKVETNWKNMIDDMFKKFKNHQGLFQGVRQTYAPIDGFADEPTKRGFVNVSSTVPEQLDWMDKHTGDFMDIVFSIEKTNASGTVKAELVVDGDSWGTYSSLELLRLKTTLDNQKFKEMYKEIPIRTQTDIWKESKDEAFTGRKVYETEIEEGFAKTTVKDSYILTDPHPDKTRAPQVAEKSNQVNIGKYSIQRFSGALSLQQRATMQVRFDNLYKAVIEALENANDVEAQESDLGRKILGYIHA